MTDADGQQANDEQQAQGKPDRKVAIIGTAPSSFRLAPFEDPEWEIWGLSRLYNALPRWDRWYEMHRLEEVCNTWKPGNEAAEHNARQEYLKWMGQQTKPIYLQQERPDIAPSGVRYPIEKILEMFPRRYFTNSVSYMLAHAIYERVPTIGVWGVDMALQEEYREQRPSCEYFIGVADGLGINMIVPPECNLMKSRRLYAYEGPDEFSMMVKAKKDTIASRKAQVSAELEKGKKVLAALEGADDMLEHMTLNWDVP